MGLETTGLPTTTNRFAPPAVKRAPSTPPGCRLVYSRRQRPRFASRRDARKSAGGGARRFLPSDTPRNIVPSPNLIRGAPQGRQEAHGPHWRNHRTRVAHGHRSRPSPHPCGMRTVLRGLMRTVRGVSLGPGTPGPCSTPGYLPATPPAWLAKHTTGPRAILLIS